MRRIKKLAIVAVVLVVVMVATGCGCACDTSGSSGGNDQNTTSGQNTGLNNGKADDGKSNTKTANSDFEPTISVEQRKAVKAEDYIQGKNFDLTGYAEALGYTRLEDPQGGVLYAMKNGNVKCFFTYDSNNMIAWFDCGDGFTYKAGPLECSTEPIYTIKSKGQEDRTISKSEGLDEISSFLAYIATSDSPSLDRLPSFKHVTKYSGSAEYYTDGLMNVRSKGQKVDDISCHPDN